MTTVERLYPAIAEMAAAVRAANPGRDPIFTGGRTAAGLIMDIAALPGEGDVRGARISIAVIAMLEAFRAWGVDMPRLMQEIDAADLLRRKRGGA